MTRNLAGSPSGRRAPGRRRRELGLQSGNASLERFVFLPRQPGHLLDGLELLAMDHVEIAQNPLRLGAQHCVEFPPHALSDAGRIVHQPGEFVVKSPRRLHHCGSPVLVVWKMPTRNQWAWQSPYRRAPYTMAIGPLVRKFGGG